MKCQSCCRIGFKELKKCSALSIDYSINKFNVEVCEECHLSIVHGVDRNEME